MVPLEERELFCKMAPKRLPRGAVSKKSFFWAPLHQKWHHFGSLGEPFSTKKKVENSSLGAPKQCHLAKGSQKNVFLENGSLFFERALF